MEREEVFARPRTSWSCGWLAEGKVDGLRIDHPDGLYDPRQYLAPAAGALPARAAPAPRVDADAGATGPARRGAAASAARRAGCGDGRRPLYVVVEKILGAGEPLPDDWAVARHQRLRLPQRRQRPVRRPGRRGGRSTALYQRLHRRRRPVRRGGLPEEAADPAASSLASELHMLAHQLDRLAQQRPPVARLHPQRPAPRAARGDRLLPGLPLLHRRRRASATRDRAARRQAVRRAAAPQPAARPARCSTSSATRCCCRTRRAARRRTRTAPSSGASPASSSR